MQSSRSKLKSTLEEAEKELSEDESEAEEEEEVAERPRKKQKTKQFTTPTTIHQSYIMKLFDRSVDLAKFDERSTLYPICRAWMKNMKGPKVNLETTKEEPTFRRKMPGMLVMINNGIEAEVRSLPPPNKSDLAGPYPPKIPAQEKSNKFNIDLNYKFTDSDLLDNEELLALNIKRWREVRDNWQTHTKEYSKRYQDSYDILDGLYNQSQGKLKAAAATS
ncbi:protein lin-37 homolog [Culicoides brevitarsis]|uniref:protein lin-37 homolog n=1 Tax=Culicoides brevitarsis TaxID=469753 RepID=UPI00307B21E3